MTQQLKRLWRGEMPLASAYFGLHLGGLVLIYLAMYAGFGQLSAQSAQLFSVLMLLLLPLYYLLSWIVVWRCAGRAQGSGKAAARTALLVELALIGI